ncbi:MAG: hypothetical protein KW804_01885 [Candidatus Doudnabacteria bacterium]|nr:hypothetical protein [Candidatus Doudnabacteria bacterium]
MDTINGRQTIARIATVRWRWLVDELVDDETREYEIFRFHGRYFVRAPHGSVIDLGSFFTKDRVVDGSTCSTIALTAAASKISTGRRSTSIPTEHRGSDTGSSRLKAVNSTDRSCGDPWVGAQSIDPFYFE